MAGMQKWKTGFGGNIAPGENSKHAPWVGHGESCEFVYDSTYSGRNAAYTNMVITFQNGAVPSIQR
jgi:hypothetical protein